MIYYAKDYSILPGGEIASQLCELIKKITVTDGEKKLVFEQGTYYLNAANCDEKMLYITNTVGDEEFSDGQTPHLNKIGINLQSISDLDIDGNGSLFIIDGKATNIAIENCNNIRLSNLTIDVDNPDLHEMTVVSKTPFSVTYSLDRTSKYVENGNGFAFTGNGYKSDFFANRVTAFWTGRVRKEEPDNIQRVRHPFFSCLSIKETAPYTFKATYLNTKRFKAGDRFYIYDARRQYAGIFVNASRNITLDSVAQRFNYSLALVCQDTENITVNNVDFSPADNSGRLMASCADFIQICMCKGNVTITNSNFSGAGDDMLNVHGVHYAVKGVDNNRLTLKYMHTQTHGYNPLHAGDSIEYVNPDTLLKTGSAVIESSRLVDEQTIEITVSSTDGMANGCVIEDTTMCPSLNFFNNTLNRIITRNLLITTRGKVVIDSNHFNNSTMASILVSDDAKNWYESGPVHDITIKNNYFGECHAEFVKVLPENGKNKVPVHTNITIENNVFDATQDKGLYFKCAKDITVKANEIKSSAVKNDFIKSVNCENLIAD